MKFISLSICSLMKGLLFETTAAPIIAWDLLSWASTSETEKLNRLFSLPIRLLTIPRFCLSDSMPCR